MGTETSRDSFLEEVESQSRVQLDSLHSETDQSLEDLESFRDLQLEDRLQHIVEICTSEEMLELYGDMPSCEAPAKTVLVATVIAQEEASQGASQDLREVNMVLDASMHSGDFFRDQELRSEIIYQLRPFVDSIEGRIIASRVADEEQKLLDRKEQVLKEKKLAERREKKKLRMNNKKDEQEGSEAYEKTDNLENYGQKERLLNIVEKVFGDTILPQAKERFVYIVQNLLKDVGLEFLIDALDSYSNHRKDGSNLYLITDLRTQLEADELIPYLDDFLFEVFLSELNEYLLELNQDDLNNELSEAQLKEDQAEIDRLKANIVYNRTLAEDAKTANEVYSVYLNPDLSSQEMQQELSRVIEESDNRVLQKSYEESQQINHNYTLALASNRNLKQELEPKLSQNREKQIAEKAEYELIMNMRRETLAAGDENLYKATEGLSAKELYLLQDFQLEADADGQQLFFDYDYDEGDEMSADLDFLAAYQPNHGWVISANINSIYGDREVEIHFDGDPFNREDRLNIQSQILMANFMPDIFEYETDNEGFIADIEMLEMVKMIDDMIDDGAPNMDENTYYALTVLFALAAKKPRLDGVLEGLKLFGEDGKYLPGSGDKLKDFFVKNKNADWNVESIQNWETSRVDLVWYNLADFLID